jgi:hypothetical protein
MPRWRVSRSRRTAKSSAGMEACEHCRHGKRRLRNQPPRRRPRRDAKKHAIAHCSACCIAGGRIPSPPTRSPTEPPGPNPAALHFYIRRGRQPRSRTRLDRLDVAVAYAGHARLQSFSAQLAWTCRNSAYTSGARSSFISSSFGDVIAVPASAGMSASRHERAFGCQRSKTRLLELAI